MLSFPTSSVVTLSHFESAENKVCPVCPVVGPVEAFSISLSVILCFRPGLPSHTACQQSWIHLIVDSQLVTNRHGGNWSRHHSKLFSVAKIDGVICQCLLATNLCLRFRLCATLLVSQRRILTCSPVCRQARAGELDRHHSSLVRLPWIVCAVRECLPAKNLCIRHPPHSLSASKNSSVPPGRPDRSAFWS